MLTQGTLRYVVVVQATFDHKDESEMPIIRHITEMLQHHLEESMASYLKSQASYLHEIADTEAKLHGIKIVFE